MELEQAKRVLSAARVSGDEKRLKAFVDSRQAKIAELQAEIDKRIRDYEEAPARIKRAEAAVVKLETEELHRKNRADILKLKRLSSSLTEVSQKGNP